MSDWLINEQEFRELEIEFEKNIKMKLLLSNESKLLAVTYWDIREVEVEKKKGSWWNSKREAIKETFYVIDTIYFKDVNTPKGMVTKWIAGKGLMCSPIGIFELSLARERYVKLKEQFKGLGMNIVKLPKRKKDE